MKKIEAIIRPEKIEGVISALETIGCVGITVTETEGHGKQKGVVQQWRGEKYTISLLPKIKIEMVVADSDVARVTALIAANAKTGEMGDGKIFISSIENAVRIRTGEEGNAAIG